MSSVFQGEGFRAKGFIVSKDERDAKTSRHAHAFTHHWLIVAFNVVIIVAIVGCTLLYLSDTRREREETRTDMFISSVETMKQSVRTYISTEQGYVNNWAQYITNNDMTEDEALDYIRALNSQSDRWAHIVDMETMEARSTLEVNGSDAIDFYAQILHEDTDGHARAAASNNAFIQTMEDIYEGGQAVLGRYRLNRSDLTVVAVGTKVTLASDSGRRDYLLLRLIPVDEVRKMWPFPPSLRQPRWESSTVRDPMSSPSASMRSESFLEFIRAYNFPDDYRQVYDLQNTLLTTDSGTLYYCNSAGEPCLWYYSSFGGDSQMDILGCVRASELVSEDGMWRIIVAIICGGLLILVVVDGITLLAINKRLKDTAASAEQANRTKTQFLSSMSHDIRTPMNAVLGMTEIAKENIGDTARVSDCLDKISVSGNYLLTLVNDILDISQVESGKMALNPAAFSVHDVVNGTADMLRGQIDSKRLAFAQSWGEVPHDTLMGDKLRISQILINLLINAAKYTPEGGNILLEVREGTVEATAQGNGESGIAYESGNSDDQALEGSSGAAGSSGAQRTRLVLVVEDNGMGMTEEFRRVMYESFSRATASQLNAVQGTGLGLAIVKRLVDLMGGTIECVSAPQQGTRFTVTLDLAVVQETDSRDAGDEAEDGSAPKSAKGMHVLVAEDSDLNWEVVSMLLESDGVTSEHAENGSVCLAMLTGAPAGTYDAVLMDVQMPGMNGLEAARAIRVLDDPSLRSIPIIAMTADAFAQDVQTCLDAGMDAHISNPSTFRQHCSAWHGSETQGTNRTRKDEGAMKCLTRREALAAGACTAAACVTALVMTGCSNEPASSAKEDGFKPRLDTQTKIDLDITGPFGNFEALDQVENNFNEIYPNVTFYYEQAEGDLGSGKVADIFATTDENLVYPDDGAKYVAPQCADLSKEDIDTLAVEQAYLGSYTVDGKLLSLPVSLKIDGIVVNETLLEKEGLKVPENFGEFMEVLESLKGLEYTPIQGPVDAVYANLISNMAGYLIGTDADLQKALEDGNLETAQAKLAPAFERLAEIVDNGYTDYAVNETYPYDNYNDAIMTFFEGDVPFWVCDTEKFSGLKKRESKSETFSAKPFEHRFMEAPMADDGACVLRKTWYGFSADADGEHLDYALEFIRFLATRTELEQIASIKDLPCVMAEGDDERYASIAATDGSNKTYCSDGTIDSAILNALHNAVKSYAGGETTIEEAEAEFARSCTDLLATRAG